MTILTDWTISLSAGDVLRGQGVDPDIVRKSKPLLMATADRALNEGLDLIYPVALTREINVHTRRHDGVPVLSSGCESASRKPETRSGQIE